MYPLALHQKLTAHPSMDSVPNITAHPSITLYKVQQPAYQEPVYQMSCRQCTKCNENVAVKKSFTAVFGCRSLQDFCRSLTAVISVLNVTARLAMESVPNVGSSETHTEHTKTLSLSWLAVVLPRDFCRSLIAIVCGSVAADVKR